MEKVEEIIPEIVLNSGQKMPLIGFGCADFSLPPLDQLILIFIDAIQIGYRHFDTAAIYGSEEALGTAIAKAIELGLIKSRDELFITSKLWIADVDPELVLPALKESLRKLGLSHLDLYLVHSPIKLNPTVGYNYNYSKEDILLFDINGTWKAMEDCCKMGLAKSIGVSNFSSEKLSQVLQYATIPPAVNQVEMNVKWQQRKLMPFCKEKKIHVSAWAALGGCISFGRTNAVMENSIVKDIAASKSKTVAQVALRWIHEQGASVIVKSFNKERMKTNLQIFDWKLTPQELNQIQQIPQCRGMTGEGIWIYPNGPYKSAEEFWDGDL